MHQVERLESGTRFAVPCFFTTEAVPEASLDHFGGVPSDDEERGSRGPTPGRQRLLTLRA